MCLKCKEAYSLLRREFGSRAASDLLWNETAYPFDSGTKTLARVRVLIKRHKGKKRKSPVRRK